MSAAEHESHESNDTGASTPVDEAVTADQEGAELSLEAQLADASDKASENWDKYLRSVAELENVRKRASRDVDNARKFAVERFANDLLAVVDSLAMGIDAAETTDAVRLREGAEATLKLLQQVFERFGISTIDPLGEPFDPEFHEAITMQPSADAEPNSVLTVIQLGYSLNGRLLRPARVIVAQAVAG